MRWWLHAVCFLLSVGTVSGCPWCVTNSLQAPTIFPDSLDKGGKLFGREPDPAKVRHYFVAAEPILWNFTPTMQDPVTKNPLPPFVLQRPTAMKVRFVQYTDETFLVRAVQVPRLGLLGPVFRAVVGEYISVTFLNRADLPLSIHPHGLKYDKDNEGSSYFPDRGKGAAVAPQASFTYIWQVDESAGPLPSEPSSKAWLYHSHVVGDDEINLGLIGFIIVTDPARAREDGTAVDVDREIPALFMIFDESPKGDNDDIPDYVQSQIPPERLLVLRASEALQKIRIREQSARHTINGLAFGNLRDLEMIEGERVRWHLLALGSENGMHTVHWHGARVIHENRRRTDVIELMPGTAAVADMLADNPGNWLFQCHVADHMMEGMYTNFRIHSRSYASTNVLTDPFFSVKRLPESLTVNSVSGSLGLEKRPHDPSNLSFKASAFVGSVPVFPLDLEVSVGGACFPFRMENPDRASFIGAEITMGIVSGATGGLGLGIVFTATFTGDSVRKILAEDVIEKKFGAPTGILELPVEIRSSAFYHTGTFRSGFAKSADGTVSIFAR